jgi:hypothetical protein
MNNSMGFVLAAFLLCLLVFRRVTLTLTRNKIVWYQDPVMLFTGAWLIQSVTYALPIFENREDLEARHVLYILLCHLAFFVGVLLVPRAQAKRNPAEAAAQITFPMLAAIGLAGLLGNFAITYDGLHASPVSLMDRFTSDGIELIRRERFNITSIKTLGPFISLEFLAAATTIFVCMMTAGVAQQLDLKRWQRRALIGATVVSFLFVIFNALVIYGGRIGVAMLLLGTVLGALMDPKRALFRFIDRSLGRAKGGVYTLLLAGALGAIWFFATAFVKDRIGETPPLAALYQYHRASPTPLVEEVIGNNESLQYALLSFSYVTVPLTTLTYYYDMPNGQFPGPYWGQYNFSTPVTFAMRRMGMVREQMPLQDIRNEATRYLRVMGYGDNVWPTLLRDIALDVGWTGVPVIMLLLGWGAELIMRSARKGDGNFIVKVLALLTSVLLVFSIAHSLFVLDSFQKAYWFCFALLIYHRIMASWKSPFSKADERLSPTP